MAVSSALSTSFRMAMTFASPFMVASRLGIVPSSQFPVLSEKHNGSDWELRTENSRKDCTRRKESGAGSCSSSRRVGGFRGRGRVPVDGLGGLSGLSGLGGWGLGLTDAGALNHAVIQAVEREFQTVGDSQLVVNLAEIILDHLLGGAHAQGNLFVLHPLGNAGDDERLLGGERHFGTRPCRTQPLGA